MGGLTELSGNPLSLNILRRYLHLALKELGYVNSHTGDHKAGSHAFRRCRNTYLKNETACPKGLLDYWLGYAGNSMDDLYDMVKDNIALRKRGLRSTESALNFRPRPHLYRKRCKDLHQSMPRKLLDIREKEWSGREDLNLRPPGPEPGALPG